MNRTDLYVQDDEASAVVKPTGADKRKVNTFSVRFRSRCMHVLACPTLHPDFRKLLLQTKSDKKTTAQMLQQLQEQSKREAAPVVERGDAAAHIEIDDNTKRTGNKWTGCVLSAVDCCLNS